MVHVVIIGGSFAGLSVAVALDSDSSLNTTVTVIEKRPFFSYTIGSPRGAVNEEFAEKTLVDFSKALTKKAKYVVGTVATVSAKSLQLEDGSTIEFDYLVIASGVKYAPPYRFSATTREAYLAETTEFRNKIKAANDIVLIGGGAANIELAGEIKTAFPSKSVSIIELAQYLAGAGSNGFPKLLHDNIAPQLAKLGVEVYLGEGADLTPFRAADGSLQSVVVGERSITVGSKSVKADFVIVAPGGYKPNTEFVRTGKLGADVLDPQGFVNVRPTLQIVGHDNIYSLGDVAVTNAPKTSAMASEQAPVVVANLKKAITGDSSKKDLLWDGAKMTRFMVLAVGPTAAGGVYGSFSVPNFMARMAKSKDLMLSMIIPRFFKP
ncbi:hypothetical protein BJ742DRAFT_372137 [Cladochytrium replicatum]|nr:hypothetical protein BJ742DRAFT_372137 [Cladochytrium replicatum]